MTSRDERDIHIQGRGQLDALIRWTLRESVEEATPPPEAWRRVCDRLSCKSEARRGARWRELRLAARSMALWLLQSMTGPRSGFPYLRSAEYVRMQGRYNLCLLMYQQDLTMLLGHVL